MALVITVAGTDRTKLIESSSLRIDNVLTRQVDTCKFNVSKFGTRTFAPTVGQEVVVTLDGTKIFAGRIATLDEQYEKSDFVQYQVSCVDYTRDLDRRLVVEVYQNQTINAIIADLQSRYWPDLTIANVDCTAEVEYIAFNYEYSSKCLQQLADLVGYDWYVDYDSDVHFFSKIALTAPIELTDTGGTYVVDSLRIKKDITPVRNVVYVRGGEYLGETQTAAFVSETNQKHFNLPYRFSDLKVMYTGQEVNVGIDNIDPETEHDALYNFQEKLVKFRADRMADGQIVRISGRPYLPVIVKMRDPASISTFSADEGNGGAYEFKIVDASIRSKEGARQRARAELLAYAQTLEEGSFQTHQDGLRAGQRIHVQSTARSIDTYYVINKVSAAPMTATGDMVYTVSLVSTKTFDYIDLLQKLLLAKDKEIVIRADEVLDEIESFDETISIAETYTAQSLNYETVFVLGSTTPSAKKRQFILSGSYLG